MLEEEEMRIILVRHGEPDYENDCLTENGLVQARATAEKLNEERLSAVYSSPLGRARITASFTAEKQGREVRILDFMHEIDWGSRTGSPIEYDGHPWTLAYRLLTDEPQYIGSDAWKDHVYFADNICMDSYGAIASGIDEFLKAYGIFREGKRYRCIEEHEDTVAIFAHGGSGAFFLAHLFDLPLPFVLTSLPFGVCSVTTIDLSVVNGEYILPRFECFNDMSHLGHVRKEGLRFGK